MLNGRLLATRRIIRRKRDHAASLEVLDAMARATGEAWKAVEHARGVTCRARSILASPIAAPPVTPSPT